MAFDPDAYLAEDAFDPDAYLGASAISADIEAKFPYPVEPVRRKTMGRGGASNQYFEEKARFNRKKAEIDKIRQLAATNPYQAQNIYEMSGGEKMLAGIGAGFTDIQRAAANLDDAITPESFLFPKVPQPGEPTGMAELEQVSDTAGAGRIIGQAAPFLPAGLAAGGLATLPARIGASSLVGGTEGAAIASGTNKDVLTGALVGTAFGGGAEIVGTAVNRIGGALIRKWFGKEAPALDAGGNPTPELNAALEQEGITFDSLTKMANTEESAKQAASVATNPTERNVADFASTLELNPLRVAAAERAGVRPPLAALSDQSQIHEIVGAAAAVPGSKTSQELIDYSKELTKKAEKTVEQFSGYLDKEVVSENLKSTIQTQIKDLNLGSKELYDKIDEAVPAETIINTRPLIAELAKRGAKSQKGVAGLSPVERDVFRAIQGKPTYFDIDNLRKDIGASIGRTEGSYTNEQVSKLKDMYSKLSQLQEGVADQVGGGAGDLWRQAKELDKKRFAMQENSEFLFGKNNIGTVMPKLESSLQLLAKGNNEPFKKIISSIPEEQKGAVVTSAIDSVIRKSYAGDVKLDANGFAKWYNQLSTSPTNKKTLMQQLPEGAEQRLDDLFLLSQGLANVTNNRTKTGVVNTVFKKFDDADGIVAKLYGISDKVAESPVGMVAGPTARIIANTAKMATKEKTPSIQAADELLASPEFRTAVFSMSDAKNKRMAAMKKLEATDAYKKYMQSQNKSRLASISAVGLIPFLAGEEEKE